MQIGFLAFQHFTHAGNGAAGAHTGYKNIDVAVGVAPDFFGGGFAVYFRVSSIFKLLRHKVNAGVAVYQFLRFGNRAAHAFGSGGQYQFGTKRAQQHTALFTHALRHGDHQFVTARRAYHRQADTGVTAGGLYDDGIFIDFTGRFGRFNHRHSNTVFHAAARVKEFQFGHHFGRQAFAQAVQLNQGGVTDQIRNTVCNIHVSLRRNSGLTYKVFSVQYKERMVKVKELLGTFLQPKVI